MTWTVNLIFLKRHEQHTSAFVGEERAIGENRETRAWREAHIRSGKMRAKCWIGHYTPSFFLHCRSAEQGCLVAITDILQR